MLRKKGGTLRYQLRRKSSSSQGDNFDHIAASIFMAARQRDAAQPAGSVYGENKHLQKLPKSHNRERSNCTGLVLKQAGMHGHFPFRSHPAVDLAARPFQWKSLPWLSGHGVSAKSPSP